MIRLGILVVLIIFIITLILRGIKPVNRGEVMIIERLGAYLATLTEGINFIVPIIDSSRLMPWQFIEKDKNGNTYSVIKDIERIPLTENIFYLLRHQILTKDYSKIEIDALVYFMVEDPVMAVYNVPSLPKAFEEIISSALKNDSLAEEITKGNCSLAENKLWENISEKAKKFGVKINKVEIRNTK